jgi:hypothetical protein
MNPKTELGMNNLGHRPLAAPINHSMSMMRVCIGQVAIFHDRFGTLVDAWNVQFYLRTEFMPFANLCVFLC